MRKGLKFVAVVLAVMVALGGVPTTISAGPAPVKLAKKSVTLAITKSDEGMVKGVSQIQVKTASGVKVGKVTYKSQNAKVASVNKKGKVTAKKKGSTKITVTVKYTQKNVKSMKTKKLTYSVSVREKVEAPSVKLAKTEASLDIDEEEDTVDTTTIKVTAAKGVKINKTTYKSSNEDVVKVNKKGKATAVDEGEATITVTVKYTKNKKKYTKKLKFKVDVTVYEADDEEDDEDEVETEDENQESGEESTTGDTEETTEESETGDDDTNAGDDDTASDTE